MIAEIDRLAVTKAIGARISCRAVAVNILGPSLTDRELDRGGGICRSALGLDPHLLSFELTETTGVANIEAARRFASYLENLGCDLALDDFGTGLSSLGYLKHIPIQTLKIDLEFVRGMSASTFDRYLVQTIVGLAKRLGQKTVAEGVEDEATLSLVRMFGVGYAQGYLLGAPRPIDSNGPRAIPSAARRIMSAAVQSGERPLPSTARAGISQRDRRASLGLIRCCTLGAKRPLARRSQSPQPSHPHCHISARRSAAKPRRPTLLEPRN